MSMRIGRGNRPDAFNLFFHRPQPLVPRDLTFEVRERMNAAGEVLIPLDPAAVEALARTARRRWDRGGGGLLSAFLCQSGA